MSILYAMRAIGCILAMTFLWACSGVTVRQKPFPELEVPLSQAPEPEDTLDQKATIELKGDIRFARGRADILEMSFSALDEIAGILIQSPQIELVEISGHTSNKGNKRRNKRLSLIRAEAVQRYLIDAAGISRDRLKVKGYGSKKPIAKNNSKSGRTKNERIDFTILRLKGDQR